MLNHGGYLKNITVGLARAFWHGPEDGVAMVLALRDIKEGEQVLFSYGDDRSNDDFCAHPK